MSRAPAAGPELAAGGGRTMRVAGFRFAGAAAEKGTSGAAGTVRGARLALAVGGEGTVVAGVFTQNRARAAPVEITHARIRSHGAAAAHPLAVVVNAGCANACTGRTGTRDALAVIRTAAGLLRVPPGRVLVASTGVIGTRLPVAALCAALPRAVGSLTEHGLPGFAEQIMTTDTFPKLAIAHGRVEGRRVTVGGAAKGAGMIAPRMATLLAFVFTDCAVRPPALRAIWREVCDATFNAVTVDGDTSTNDTALCLASGRAGNRPVSRPLSKSGRKLGALLVEVAGQLARNIARDGEGATHFVEIVIEGARSAADAWRVARRIAESPLVKTAIAGGDPNWGRIVCAAGNSGVPFRPGDLSVSLGPVLLVRRGQGTGAEAEKAARAVMQRRDYAIGIRLGRGPGRARMFTCDLTEEYIRVNAHYRT